MSRANDFDPKSRFGPVGIGVMVLFHVLVGYALVSGLARKTIEMIKKPMDATIITFGTVRWRPVKRPRWHTRLPSYTIAPRPVQQAMVP